MSNQAPISDQRMLQLLQYLLDTGKIRFRQEFCDAIGMSKQQIVLIIAGKQGFTVSHITAACKAYGCDANWVLGLKKTMFASTDNKKSNSRTKKEDKNVSVSK